MQVFKRILKELGIAILFLLLILGVLAFAFYDKVPFSREVPDSIDYTNIEKSKYDVRGDVEEQKNATQTYQTSVGQLESYLTEKIVSPGRFEPFAPVNSVSDIPNERVGVTTGEDNAQPKTSAQSTSTANTTGDVELE